MRLRKRWLVPTTLVGAALAWRLHRRGGLDRLVENLHRYSAPTATLYDTVTAPLVGRFFARVVGDLTGLAPRARVLEIGSGPGRLAAKLAEAAPDLQVTGLDIAPEMVQRASLLAARSGVADRVAFRVGDVAALPFGDASFDVVVSTFSAHHWQTRPPAWPRSTGCSAQAASLGSTTWPTGSRGWSGTAQASPSSPATAPLTAVAPSRNALPPSWARSR
jgi:SAM-dependent methyltransferase